MFKHCNVCQHKWMTREEFMADGNITIIGYQANFNNLEAGHLYFNHNCKNTIVLSTDKFSDLYDGPIFDGRKTGTETCPQYCLNKDELKSCQAECECAYVRDIIQLFKQEKYFKIA